MKEYTEKRLQELTGFKTCSCCNQNKPLQEFGRLSAAKIKKETVQHYKSVCKICNVKASLLRYYGKQEELKEYQRQYAERNRDKKKLDPSYKNSSTIYSSRNRKATPRWLTKEQRKQIRVIYKVRVLFDKDTERTFEVDHIVPLNSNYVCGLHVPWNLQILTSEENNRKSNSIQNDALRALYVNYVDFVIDADLISMLIDFNNEQDFSEKKITQRQNFSQSRLIAPLQKKSYLLS